MRGRPAAGRLHSRRTSTFAGAAPLRYICKHFLFRFGPHPFSFSNDSDLNLMTFLDKLAFRDLYIVLFWDIGFHFTHFRLIFDIRVSVAMFMGGQLTPGDTVTTRWLQKARRSAERKGVKQRSAAGTESQGFAKRGSSEQFGEGTEDETSASTVEQGLHFLCKFSSNQNWNMPALCRIWSFGFCCEHVSSLLNNLPPSILGCCRHVSKTWENIIKAHSTDSLKKKFGCWLDMDSAYATALDQNSSLCKLTMTYDALTQMRTGYSANVSMASMLDMSHDALNRRLARHDLPLLFCELDFVADLLHQTLRELTVPGVWRVKFLRIMPGAGAHRRCVLVCWCSFARADGDGRVVEVSPQQAVARPIIIIICHLKI